MTLAAQTPDVSRAEPLTAVRGDQAPDRRQGEAAVEVISLSKRFGSDVAVQEASFSLKRGDFLTILGPSGCGKTTILRMIAGFIAPDGGTIRLNGAPLSKVAPHRRSIGMVFQRLALFPHLTVFDNVAYPLKRRRFAAAQIPDRVKRFLDIVRLAGFDARYPHELSGGQQQRVAIARALVFEPDLLLLDEPLSSLDRKLREEMQEEFKRIQKAVNVTTINVTHDQKEALVLSDRLIVMSNGRIEQQGAPRDVYQRPRTLFVASFLGTPNLLKGVVEEVDGAIRLRVGATHLPIDPRQGSISAGQPATAAIRLESVMLGEAAAACDVTLEGVVAAIAFEGERSVVSVASQGAGDCIVRAFRDDRDDAGGIAVGDPIAFGWNRNDCLVFQSEAEDHKEQ